MQKDMHYYGTYAMARAAGIRKEAARIIASAAQFVDDNAKEESMEFDNGEYLRARASGHHALDMANLNFDDQRHVWVPFHFLPGNQGMDFKNLLVCRKDSVIAQKMMENHLLQSQQAYALELLGIAAHVYADTFSHYGFSGISSSVNEVKQSTIEFGTLKQKTIDYIRGKEASFKTKTQKTAKEYVRQRDAGLDDKLLAQAAEDFSKGLGHGAVATFPDRPYLTWRFKYENTRDSGWRSNPETFLEYCQRIHYYFSLFASSRLDFSEPETKLTFSSISDTVETILGTEGRMSEREDAWKKAAAAGKLYADTTPIPEYLGDKWLRELKTLDSTQDHGSGLVTLPFYRFYQASSYHRNYILRDLLPAHGLVVA